MALESAKNRAPGGGMTLDPAVELHRTAVHEAGHAVSEFVLTGVGPVVVGIVPNPASGSAGSTHSLYGPDGRSVDDYESFIVSLFAGHAAWLLFCGGIADAATAGNEDDEAQASRFLPFVNGDPAENEARLRARAADLVAENWRACQRVAAELIEFEVLDGNEVEFLIQVERGELPESELQRYRELFGMNFPGKARSLLKVGL